MFRFNPNPTFTALVPISVPGVPEPMDVSITFRHKNKVALKAWIASASGKEDAALLHEVVVDWSGPKSDEGEPVAYSLTNLGEFLNNYGTAHGEIFRAYLKELTESKRKN